MSLEQPGELELLTAALRADAADLALTTGSLLAVLAGCLPPAQMTVRRAVSWRQRLRGGAAGAPVLAVSLHLGRERFTLARPSVRSTPQALVEQVVNGVVLKTDALDVESWSQRLAVALTEQARRSEATRHAVDRLLRL